MMNLKAISKVIKSEKKGKILWQVKDNVHYISNGHWAVKLPHLTSEVIVALTERFLGKIPEPDAGTLTYNAGHINTSQTNICEMLFSSPNLNETGTVTRFTIELDNKKNVKSIKFPSFIAVIDVKYATFLDNETYAETSGKLSPIYFCDRSLAILPFRVDISEYLKEIGA
jgi:hypothetical protein